MCCTLNQVRESEAEAGASEDEGAAGGVAEGVAHHLHQEQVGDPTFITITKNVFQLKFRCENICKTLYNDAF